MHGPSLMEVAWGLYSDHGSVKRETRGNVRAKRGLT